MRTGCPKTGQITCINFNEFISYHTGRFKGRFQHESCSPMCLVYPEILFTSFGALENYLWTKQSLLLQQSSSRTAARSFFSLSNSFNQYQSSNTYINSYKTWKTYQKTLDHSLNTNLFSFLITSFEEQLRENHKNHCIKHKTRIRWSLVKPNHKSWWRNGKKMEEGQP